LLTEAECCVKPRPNIFVPVRLIKGDGEVFLIKERIVEVTARFHLWQCPWVIRTGLNLAVIFFQEILDDSL
jgi:hypothetical protein